MQQMFPCSKCGWQNAIGQRFCTGCGEKFQYNCPQCGSVIDSAFRFCPNCHADLGWGIQQQPGWMPQQPRWASSAPRSQLSSPAQLLILVVVVLLLGLGGFVYWQFGSQSSTADTTPPIISNISVLAKTEQSATIVWKTDEAASSQVEYGKTSSYGLISPSQPQNDLTSGSPGVTTHGVNLSPLQPGTIYHYRVKSKDAAGNEAVSAGDRTFKTLESTTY